MNKQILNYLVIATVIVSVVFMSSCDSKDDKGNGKEDEVKPREFTVIFNSNGGSTINSQTVKDGEKATKPNNPTRNGFTFDAWYKEVALKNAWNFEKDIVKANMTLYANWKPSNNSNIWTRKADFAGGNRHSAVGFSIGNKGYVGTGSPVSKEFWEYDPASNSWTQKADFAGENRRDAVGFSIGNKGYIGLGAVSGYISREFWEYDPVSNSWTQKANFSGSGITYSVGFSIGNKGYIAGTYSVGSNFWEYDPIINKWTKKADYPQGGVGAVGFSIGNKGYIFSGSNNQYFWEYDPDLDSWTKKADFSGRGRINAVGFSIGNKGYVGTGIVSQGGGNGLGDFWEYDPVSDIWTQKAILPGRWRAIGFSIGNKGYVGTGEKIGDWSNPLQDFWEFTP